MSSQARYRVHGIAIARTTEGVQRVLMDGTVIDGMLERVEGEDGRSGPEDARAEAEAE